MTAHHGRSSDATRRPQARPALSRSSGPLPGVVLDAGTRVQFALPLERSRDGARDAVGGVVDGDEDIDVHVLDAHASRTQAHVDLAALVRAAPLGAGTREPHGHPPDPLPETPQSEAEPALDVGPEDLRHLDVALANVDLHLRSMGPYRARLILRL